MIKELEQQLECNNGFDKRTALKALAYINQLEAEVERYKDNLNAVLEERSDENIKSEAIKEFAERLKAKVRMNCFCEKLVFESDIDSLVKEMVG